MRSREEEEERKSCTFIEVTYRTRGESEVFVYRQMILFLFPFIIDIEFR